MLIGPRNFMDKNGKKISNTSLPNRTRSKPLVTSDDVSHDQSTS